MDDDDHTSEKELLKYADKVDQLSLLVFTLLDTILTARPEIEDELVSRLESDHPADSRRISIKRHCIDTVKGLAKVIAARSRG